MINARVNEKLYFTKLALNAAEQADRATQSALLEAAVFHLFCAYRCYLQEVVGNTSTPFVSASDLAQSLPSHSADFQELLILERQSSWLSQLLAAYQTTVALLPKVTPVAAELAVIDISAQLDYASCRNWLQQFQQLLQRQREHAQEW